MMAATTSNAGPDSPAEDSATQTHHTKELSSIDDHALPKSVIVRLAKSVLPDSTMIQKEAVTALVKSATVFVNYLAATANDITQQKGKKTINNEEVLSALDIIEFDDIMGPQLRKHIEQFEIARTEKRKRVADEEDERKKRKSEGDLADEITVEMNGDEDGETESEKATEEPESGNEEERETEGVEEDEEGEEEERGEDDSLPFDMEEPDDGEEEGGGSDEALAEDSD